MENTAKALVITFAIGLWSCKAKVDRSGHPSSSSPPIVISDSAFPKAVKPIRNPIGNGLYRDSQGALYLKTENRRMRNPSNESNSWPDSIFHSKVSLREWGVDSSLTDLLDTSTFSPISEAGVYFQDSALIYVYAIWPYPDQFFALKKAGARFLDTEKKYLLAGGVLYWDGKVVDGIDAMKAKVVRFKKAGKEGYHEFITDDRFLVLGYYPLDEERFSLVADLSERDREYIRKRFFGRKSMSKRELIP